jgi:hypothetical protein
VTNTILSLIKRKYPLAELDVGEFAKLKVNGMKFTVSAYHAEGLGHVSVMRATGFFGLMQMDTLIVNPTEIDLPLYSYDRIFAMGNDTLIVELYDTLLGEYSDKPLEDVKAKPKFAELPDRDPGEHWYDSIKLASSISKKGKKKHTDRLHSLAHKHFDAYIESTGVSVSDKAKKLEKAAVYVDGLLKNGGPSTDVFKKALGEEKTAQLFRNVLFGITK